jgi:hypothetical protein
MPFKFNDPIVGGTVLRIPAIQSPGFVAGASGWIIRIDGSAEFNNLNVRGTFTGNNYVINTLGEFFYSGTPAAGNLVQSITNAAGADDGHGNAFLAGVTTYTNIGGTFFAVNVTQNQVSFYISPAAAGPYSKQADVRLTGSAGAGVLALDATGQIAITAPVDLSGQPSPNMSALAFPWVLDIWHPMALLGGTTAGTDINGTAYPPSYTLGPDGNLHLRGVVTAPGGLPSGTTFATILNPDYLPTTNVPVALISNGTHGTLAHVYIRPNGNLQFNAALGAGVSMFIDCTLNIQGT